MAALFAGTHPLFQPPAHAALASVHPCGRSPRYWMSESGRLASSAAARTENGSTPDWSNTDRPSGCRSGSWSPKPRTPRSEP